MRCKFPFYALLVVNLPNLTASFHHVFLKQIWLNKISHGKKNKCSISQAFVFLKKFQEFNPISPITRSVFLHEPAPSSLRISLVPSPVVLSFLWCCFWKYADEVLTGTDWPVKLGGWTSAQHFTDSEALSSPLSKSTRHLLPEHRYYYTNKDSIPEDDISGFVSAGGPTKGNS